MQELIEEVAAVDVQLLWIAQSCDVDADDAPHVTYRRFSFIHWLLTLSWVLCGDETSSAGEAVLLFSYDVWMLLIFHISCWILSDKCISMC